MRNSNDRHVASGVLAGIAGGLVASWVMNEFMEDIGPRIEKVVEGQEKPRPNEAGNGKTSDDATMKTADAIVATVTGGRHLSQEGKKKGGPMVHYAFGALMGGVYGAFAETVPGATSGFGTGFGTALFAGADLLAVPALHLSGSPSDSPAASLSVPFAAHLVYGLATEAVRRVVRAVL